MTGHLVVTILALMWVIASYAELYTGLTFSWLVVFLYALLNAIETYLKGSRFDY